MNAMDKIREAENAIRAAQEEMKNCRHDFTEPKSDPEPVTVADDWAGYEEHGSDRWPRLSFHTEYKPRWSRTCKVCGFIQYTHTEETVQVIKKPKF